MTDEAAFAMNGTVNTQNTRHWSEHRPAGNVFETSLRRGKASVWSGICRNGAVIGPFFYDGALNNDTYNNMLQENIITSIRELTVSGSGIVGSCRTVRLHTDVSRSEIP